MKTPRDLWTDLRSSFWFVPAVIVCAAVTLAFALIETDRVLAPNVRDSWPRLFGAGAAATKAPSCRPCPCWSPWRWLLSGSPF